ncbi:MAG: hypothetical protein WCT03_02350 [Candidatus Obscuribacterales bacterium]|jgi:hypothetical protein
MEQLIGLIGRTPAPVFCAILLTVGFATCMFWKLLRDLSILKAELGEVDKFLSGYFGPVDGETLELLNEKLRSFKVFGECWAEFEETLVPVRENGKDYQYNTQRASVFINEELLVDKNVSVGFYQAVPGILTGLGLLGTFTAIIWGLSSLNFDHSTGQVHGIEGFIESLGGKFLSSLVGLFFSITFLVFEKLQFGKVQRLCLSVQNQLDRLFPQQVVEKILFSIQKGIEEQANALRIFNSELAMHLKQGLQDSIVPTMKLIVEAVDSLNKTTEELKQQKEQSASDLVDTIVSNFKSALTDHTSAELTQLRDAMTATAEQQLKTRDGLENVSNAFAKLSEEVHSTTRDFIEQLRSTVSEMIGDNRTWSSEFRERFSVDLNQQSEFNNSLQIKIKDSIHNSIDSLETAFDQHLKNVSDRMDGVLTRVSTWANESSDELSKYANALASQSSAIVTAGDSIKEASTDLDTMFKEQKEFLESLREAISTFRTVAETVTVSAERVAALQDVSQEGIQTLTAEINRNAQMFKDSESLMNTQKEVYAALDGGISRSLLAINEATRQYSEHTRESLGDYLSQFDKHLSDAVSQLDGTVDELEEAMGDLSDAVGIAAKAFRNESAISLSAAQAQPSNGASETERGHELGKALSNNENQEPDSSTEVRQEQEAAT